MVRIQLRRDTAANWTSSNPTLRAGEVGIETDTLKFKIGNGTSTWTQITAYANVTPSSLTTSLASYIESGDLGQPSGPAQLSASGDLLVPENSILMWNAATYDYTTTLTATEPTADRTITFKDGSGTVAFTTDVPSNTDSLSEGTTNKYFTDERAQDAIGTALAAGTHSNITVSYDDSANSISLSASGAVASLSGTSNEVEVTNVGTAYTVGLPNDVTVGNNLTVTGKIASVDSIQIDKTATVTPAEGELAWNSTDGTIQLGMIGGNFATNIGRDVILKVFNAESTTIPKGSIVYLYGAQGDRPSVKLASNSSETTSSKTLGITAEAIASSSDGLIVTQGMLSGLSLGSYNPGDVLWLGSTAGSFTATKPSAPNHMVFIGVVAKANNGNGMVYIKPQNGYELEELHNVQISSVANNDVLKYDSSSSTWKNTDTLSLDSLTVTDLTVNGTTTTVNSTNLEITDPLIYIGTGNSANANDLGIVGHFDNGTYQHTGIVRDATDGVWKLFSGVTTEPGTTVDFTGATYDTLKAGAFQGNLTGNVTGNLTGDVTGTVSGNAGTVTNGVYTTGSYSNPSWITGLAWSKVSSTPTTLSGYGITDALSSSTAASTYQAIVSGVSDTEIGYLDGVTSAIQTQLDAKIAKSLVDAKGDILVGTADNTVTRLGVGTDGYLLTADSSVTNGVKWAAAPVSLPDQTSNTGKYLTTDGSSASWATLVVPIETGTATVNQNTAQDVDTTALSAFTSIEYMVSLKQGSKIRTSKVIVQTDGTSVDMTEFAITETGGTIAGVVVSATTASSNAKLQVTATDATSTNVTVKFSKVKL